ncbi:MAG: helix-turn-helix domain-containing protein [Alphaproteobacteria bacterium]|nr:helix-turn-helix domain-containing protein [Alphaproteobacteria bacterium]
MGRHPHPGRLPQMRETERDPIVQALRRGGNVAQAAAGLGIRRDTMRYRMERHGLKRSTFT